MAKRGKGQKQNQKEKKGKIAHIMDFSCAMEKLKASPEFSRWRAKSPKDCLASAFTIIEGKEPQWQACFYDSKKDRVTTFTITGNLVSVQPESEVFKEPGKKMERIDEENVRIDLPQLISITSGLQREKYPSEKPMKIIAVLTGCGNGALWSVTYLTQSFKTLVIKVDAKSGEVVSDAIISFFSTLRKDYSEKQE